MKIPHKVKILGDRLSDFSTSTLISLALNGQGSVIQMGHAIVISDKIDSSLPFNEYKSIRTSTVIYDDSVIDYISSDPFFMNVSLPHPLTKIETKVPVCKISCGFSFSLALSTMGDIFTWGLNNYGELGLNLTTVKAVLKPQKIVDGLNSERIIDAHCGSYHVLAMSETKKVYTWGKYQGLVEGQCTFQPRQIRDNLIFYNVDKIKANHETSAIITSDGILLTFGANTCGELGHGIETAYYENQPRKVEALIGKKVIDVSCGIYHILALVENLNKHEVYVWGSSTYGQSGTGEKKNILVPKLIENLENVVSIHAGGYHSVFMTENNDVYTCGDISNGATGLSSDLKGIFSTPQALNYFKKRKMNIRDVSCGDTYTLALIYKEE